MKKTAYILIMLTVFCTLVLSNNQSMSKLRKKITGIYFLIKDNTIVYIGQSSDTHKRVISHSYNKSFDSFRVIECRSESLSHYEKRLINYFRPPLNGSPGGKRKGAGRPKTKEETKVMRVPKSMIEKVRTMLKEKWG